LSWRDGNANPEIGRRLEQITVPVDAVVGNDQLDHGVRPRQCLGDGLRTLDEKSPSYLPFLTA
jgi:hypothetical protein